MYPKDSFTSILTHTCVEYKYGFFFELKTTVWCFWLFKVNKTTPYLAHLSWTIPESQYNMQSNSIEVLGNVPAQNYIWNKSRRVSHIPGTGISSLIMQIRPWPSMPQLMWCQRRLDPVAEHPNHWISSTCGSGRPLLMQQHVQKTIPERLLFPNAPLARTTDSCSHVFLKPLYH